MNKLTLGFIFSVLLVTASSAFAVNNAVEIGIGGIGPGVDEAALSTVSQVIGSAVANGVVDKFIVKGYGIEGGFSACAQASPFTKKFGAFVKQLKTIKANPNTTAYSVHLVAACNETVTFCTQDVKLCPDGSYVSRVGPSCSFAPCPGL
ncbi:MAG: hypothetical protein ABL884_04195 [Methyloglobulus sp.]